MKVLIVARYKAKGYAPFITEQVAALEKIGIQCQCFGINQKGVIGYLRQINSLRKAVRDFHPDIIHAHYGMSGLLSNFQRRIPVVTTYHGSDINRPKARVFSRFSIVLSALNIFVSQKSIDLVHPKKNYVLIPCGISLEDFPMIDKHEARAKMGLNPEKKYILFAGSFDIEIKNAPLAHSVIDLLKESELIELKGYTRSEVACLIQAVDALLMTSFSEGSPQIIKEAMACGCPIVSVDVGDVKELVSGLNGCYVSSPDKKELADALRRALSFTGRTEGRARLKERQLTNSQIATRIKHEYELVLRKY